MAEKFLIASKKGVVCGARLRLCNTNLHCHTLTTNTLREASIRTNFILAGCGHVLGTFDEVIEDNLIIGEKVGSN